MGTEEELMRAWDALYQHQREFSKEVANEVRRRTAVLRIVRDTGNGVDEVLQIDRLEYTADGIYIRVR